MVSDPLREIGPAPKAHDSIFACIDPQRKKALLIDTAFPEFSQKVKVDLQAEGIEVEMILLSHYHPDHAAGCVVFPGSRILASRHFEDNLANCRRWEPSYTFVTPGKTIRSGDSLDFGPFHFSFMELPGHSQCSLVIYIEPGILHCGDLLMYNAENRPTLPYISLGGSFREHIYSLEILRNREFKVLLIPHGHFFTDREKVNDDIDDRIYYLKRVFNSKGTLPLAVCLKKNLSHYGNPEFHDNNLMHLMLEQ